MSVNPHPQPHSGGWRQQLEYAIPWTLLWGLMVAALIYFRPPTSLDELRMLAITWEMWQREIFLIPVLNELAAPEQPPLMPWLIITGWKLFGVNDWWPRLLPALFSWFSLFLVSRIGALLWMDQIKIPRYAPFLILASWLWAFYLTFALVDHLLTFFTLLALFGILHAWRYTTRIGWFIYGFATGCAVLASGLTSLLYTLPVALAGPLWAGREHALRWRNWYIDIATGLVVGVGLVAMWGLVVSIEFGVGYALDHLVGVLPEELKMFARNQPIYWYAVLLPVAFMPWTVWPLVYSRLWQVRDRLPSVGTLFCLVWVVPVLVVLSVLGPRQPQYLLPILPAFALLVSYLLFNEELVDQGEDRFVMSLLLPTLLLGLALLGVSYAPDPTVLPATLRDLSPLVGAAITVISLVGYGLPRAGLALRIFIIVLGVLLAVIPLLPYADAFPPLLRELPVYVGILVALAGVVASWVPTLALDQRVLRNAAFSMVLVIVAVGYINKDKNDYQAVTASSAFLTQIEEEGRPVAHVGIYNGQFHYYGRLREAYKELDPEEITAWVAEHPTGIVITYSDEWQPAPDKVSEAPIYEASFAGKTVRIWNANSLNSV